MVSAADLAPEVRLAPCDPHPPFRKKLGGGPRNCVRRLLRPLAGLEPKGVELEDELRSRGACLDDPPVSLSYCSRFSGTPRTPYASEILTKRSEASGSLRL